MAGLRLAFARATKDIKVLWSRWVHDLAGALLVIKNVADDTLTSVVTGVGEFIYRGIGEEAKASALKTARNALAAGRQEALQRQFQALEGSRADAVKGYEDEVSRLEDELRALRDRARPQQTAEEITRPELPAMPELRTEGLAQVAAAVEESATRLRAIGTFNVAAAAGVAGAVTAVQNRIANATQATAENTASILAALQDGGASFT